MKKEQQVLPKHTTFDSYSVGKITGAIFFDTRREKKGGFYPIKYRVTFQRKQKYFDSGFSMSIRDWNIMPRTKNKDLQETRALLINGNDIIKEYIKELVSKNNFSFETLKNKLKRGDATSVNSAFVQKIKKLEKNGQVGTAGIYDSAIKSFASYNNDREIRFLSINPDWLAKYEEWFVGDDKNSYATASIYLRCLRAIFNEAINTDMIPGTSYPFGKGKYEIPSSPGRNMALTLPQIKTLIEYQVEPGSTTEKMRDLWLFSYMANGMNIKDLVSLKWKHISDGEIIYFREKTRKKSKEKRPIIVPVLKEIEQIFEKWGTSNTSPDAFVFGYLDNKNNSPERVRVVSQNVTRLMNKHLKKITDATGLPHISTYTARHSFSTVLLRSGANVEFISEALGHASIETTKTYLAGFETEARRKMNSNLLNFNTNNEEYNSKEK